MAARVRVSEPDLRALLSVVSGDRDDPPAEGLPPSMLADLAGLIRCDILAFSGMDSSRNVAAAGAAPRARPGLLRTRSGAAHPAAPAPAPGVLRRRTPPPPHPAVGPPPGGTAASGRRRAHQRPNRPPAQSIGRNRAHSPAKHLRQAAGVKPHGRGHPRLPRSRSPVAADRRAINLPLTPVSSGTPRSLTSNL